MLLHLPRDELFCACTHISWFACAYAKSAWMHMKPLHAIMSIMGQKAQPKTPKLHFSTWWPWPLSYDLDHQTRPRCHQGQSLCQILWLYINQFYRESAHTLTHRHTHTQTPPFLWPQLLMREVNRPQRFVHVTKGFLSPHRFWWFFDSCGLSPGSKFPGIFCEFQSQICIPPDGKNIRWFSSPLSLIINVHLELM